LFFFSFFCSFISICFGGVDYYQLLGVSRSATEQQISRAYKQEARKWHPDKFPKDEKAKAQERFQQISAAYEVLMDEEKRRVYDQYGEDGLKQQQQGGQRGFDPFGDLFGNMFGGQRQQQGQRDTPRGPDLVIELDVSLKDLYVGRELIITHKKQILCPHCRGTGAKNPDDVQTCPVCKGSGVNIVTQRLGPGFVTQTQTTCDKCGGKGRIVKGVCPHCNGHKIATAIETLTVVVERGMANGADIVFEQEGNQGPDMTPGNIVFKLNTLPHPRFIRNGDDINYSMNITLLEALIGFKRGIKHLDGHLVTIQRSSVTKPGFTMLIKGEGMPTHQFPSQRGDLYITFTVKFPERITEEQRQGFITLLKEEKETKTADKSEL